MHQDVQRVLARLQPDPDPPAVAAASSHVAARQEEGGVADVAAEGGKGDEIWQHADEHGALPTSMPPREPALPQGGGVFAPSSLAGLGRWYRPAAQSDPRSPPARAPAEAPENREGKAGLPAPLKDGAQESREASAAAGASPQVRGHVDTAHPSPPIYRELLADNRRLALDQKALLAENAKMRGQLLDRSKALSPQGSWLPREAETRDAAHASARLEGQAQAPARAGTGIALPMPPPLSHASSPSHTPGQSRDPSPSATPSPRDSRQLQPVFHALPAHASPGSHVGNGVRSALSQARHFSESNSRTAALADGAQARQRIP